MPNVFAPPPSYFLLLLALLAAGASAGGTALAAQVEGSWRSDLLANVDGGARTGRAHVGQFDLSLGAETPGLFGTRASWRLSGFWNEGGTFADLVGDVQVVSNIEANGRGFRINEAWLDQPLPGIDGRLLLGRYDLNGEFDVLEAALPFVNSAFGIGTDLGASGENGPSIFPATGLGTRLEVEVTPSLRLRLAAVDGVPGQPEGPRRQLFTVAGDEGAFLIGEFAWQGPSTRVLLGRWAYTRTRDSLCAGVPGYVSGDAPENGTYLRAERVLARSTGGGRTSAFLRLGTASGAHDPIDRFVSAGILLEGPVTRRPADAFGAAFAGGRLSQDFRRARAVDASSLAPREGAFEVFYRLQVTEQLALQPLAMLVTDPGGVEDDALVLGLRVELAGAFRPHRP